MNELPRNGTHTEYYALVGNDKSYWYEKISDISAVGNSINDENCKEIAQEIVDYWNRTLNPAYVNLPRKLLEVHKVVTQSESTRIL